MLTNGSSAVNGCHQNESSNRSLNGCHQNESSNRSFLQTHSFSHDSNWLTENMVYLWIIIMFYSHSDGTHSLQRINWWASNVMQHFSKSVQIKKWTHLRLWWTEGDYIFNYFLSFPLIIIGALSKFLSESYSFQKYRLPLFCFDGWPVDIPNHTIVTAYPQGLVPELGQEWHSFRTSSHFHFQTAVRGSLVRDQHGFRAGSEPRSAIQDYFSSPSGKVYVCIKCLLSWCMVCYTLKGPSSIKWTLFLLL